MNRACVGFGAALLLGTLFAWQWPTLAADWITFGRNKSDVARVHVDAEPLDRSHSMPNIESYSMVVEQASESVVNVFSAKIVRTPQQRQMLPFFNDPFFHHFFGPRAPRVPEQWSPKDRREQSLGSGVIITTDGYILTNSHVVEGADEVKIALSGSRQEHTARIVGTDPKTDIALLKVDVQNLPAITVADSDNCKVGDVVFAIGNPFGVGQTVTMGIVSATGRGVGMLDYEDFIQTDAAINPGNSGGALIDARGRLIGVSTAIISKSGGSQGIGFAVPANLACRMMESIIDDGKVSRGFLGVTIQDITAELQKAFQLPETGGAVVTSVMEDGAAEAAGIEVGDVIIAFNGKSIRDVRQLRLLVAATPPDKDVNITVWRNGHKTQLTAKLRALNSTDLAATGKKTDAGNLLKGVTVEPYNAHDHQELNVPSHIRGLVVTDVAVDALAAGSLRRGDVIIEINRQSVRTIADAHNALRNSKDSVLLYVWNRGGRFVVIRQ